MAHLKTLLELFKKYSTDGAFKNLYLELFKHFKVLVKSLSERLRMHSILLVLVSTICTVETRDGISIKFGSPYLTFISIVSPI